jgi:hypothetical protein
VGDVERYPHASSSGEKEFLNNGFSNNHGIGGGRCGGGNGANSKFNVNMAARWLCGHNRKAASMWRGEQVVHVRGCGMLMKLYSRIELVTRTPCRSDVTSAKTCRCTNCEINVGESSVIRAICAICLELCALDVVHEYYKCCKCEYALQNYISVRYIWIGSTERRKSVMEVSTSCAQSLKISSCQ